MLKRGKGHSRTRMREKRSTPWRQNVQPRGLKAVLAVAGNHGELIGLLRLAGAPLASIHIAANKAYASARERKPPRAIGKASRGPADGSDVAYFGDPRFAGWGGGVPVVVGGACVGAVRRPGALAPISTGNSDLEWTNVGGHGSPHQVGRHLGAPFA